MVGNPFWAADGGDAHWNGFSMAVHNGRRGSPVAGHRRGGECQSGAWQGPQRCGGARLGVDGDRGRPEKAGMRRLSQWHWSE
jgi:hypothetical protein